MKEIPDTSKWGPRKDKQAWLKTAFIEQCLYSENLIRMRLELEKRISLNAFDAGLPLEEIILCEFARLFPKRYAITNGIISDSSGQTAGDCDLVVFNDLWFPKVLSGISNESRKKFFPIDGVYAIGEIKTSLNESRLDDACQKLVSASRLKRPSTNSGRIIENRDSGCIHGSTNPLYTFILATNLDSNITFEDLISRFFYINKQLKRTEVIRALCVLGHGTVFWGFHDRERKEDRVALFMKEDLFEPIHPIYIPYQTSYPTLYTLLTNLHLHLFHSVLAPEDFALYYGGDGFDSKTPSSKDVVLQPDAEWLAKLDIKCDEH